MARKARDYKAEYARRTRNVDKADREALARARGHVSTSYERVQRQEARERARERKQTGGSRPTPRQTLERLIRETTYGLDSESYRDIIDAAIENMTGATRFPTRGSADRWMIQRLRKKKANTAEYLARVARGLKHGKPIDATYAAFDSEGNEDYYSDDGPVGERSVTYGMAVEVYFYHGGGS